MPIIQWDQVFTVEAPLGNLVLNEDLYSSQGAAWAGRIFRLNPKRCRANRNIRAVSDPLPGGDGQNHHERWSEGYQVQLAVALWDGDQIACDAALQQMTDLLGEIFWSMLRTPGGDGGRVRYTPYGEDARMIDGAHLLSFSDPEEGEEGAVQFTVVVDTRFPYLIDVAQTVTNINGVGVAGNGGNVEFWPVIKVNAPGTAFTITNNDTGDQIVYSGQSIGGGQYAEIDTFRGTIYLNGDQDNLKSSIIWTQTKFFPIQPGGTSITTTDSCDFLLNDAWA